MEDRIHYSLEVVAASWSSEDQRWCLQIRSVTTGEMLQLSCGFLWMCQGYYRHSKGYTPDFKGMGDFQGKVVHPQHWPEDLDYKGKRVIVIGSGATAATLVPSMADDCSHITMLQRSPTYFFTDENRNELADTLRELDVPADWIHEIVRRSIFMNTPGRVQTNPGLSKPITIWRVRYFPISNSKTTYSNSWNAQWNNH